MTSFFLFFLVSLVAYAEEMKPIATGREQFLCSKLSSEEQAFAFRLNEENRRIFCAKFSPEQRKAAMHLSCQGDAYCEKGPNAGKRALSPNDAVRRVMKDQQISWEAHE